MADNRDHEECGICMNKYDKKKHAARVLPCTHVLCTHCLHRLKDSDHLLQCPFDRETFAVPGNSVRNFPLRTHRAPSQTGKRKLRLPLRITRTRRLLNRETTPRNTITNEDFVDERNLSENAIWDYEDKKMQHNHLQTTEREQSTLNLPLIFNSNSDLRNEGSRDFDSDHHSQDWGFQYPSDVSLSSFSSDNDQQHNVSSMRTARRPHVLSLPNIRSNVQKAVNITRNFVTDIKMKMQFAFH